MSPAHIPTLVGAGPLSDERGVRRRRRGRAPVPSTLGAYETCALKALLDSFGAEDENAVSASLGSAIHAVREAAADDAESPPSPSCSTRGG
jgi:hypothetical protein